MPDNQKFVTPELFAAYVKPLQTQLDALADVTPVTSWADVQKAVRTGIAAKIFSVGDQLISQRGGNNLVWDIIGIDHDTPADTQFTHSLTLQLHDCFASTMQFDAPEALYYCDTALSAGSYHFAVSGVNYGFTVTGDGIAAGSQLILNFTDDTPTSISVSATKGGAASGSISVEAVQDVTGSTALVTNNIDRVKKGSNNYKDSAIRQWLNSNAAAGAVWTPQTDYDRPPLWAANTAGFMNGMDADFLAVIGKTVKVTARNTVTDGGGANGATKSDETEDYFFLLSRSEVYGGDEVTQTVDNVTTAVVNEGVAYPYYADYSDLDQAGTGADSNRVKDRGGSAYMWWLRTPYSGFSQYIRYVYTQGSILYTNVNNTYGVAPACNII